MAKGERQRRHAEAQRKCTKVQGQALTLHEKISQFELFSESIMPELQKMALED